MEDPAGLAALAQGGAFLEPEDVAAAAVAGIREERFLILPHEEVARYMAIKSSDPERWLDGMRRIVREANAEAAKRS